MTKAEKRRRLLDCEPFLDAAMQWVDFQNVTGLQHAPLGSDWAKARRHLMHARKAYMRAFAADVLGRGQKP